jgi:outer membrane protein
MVLPASAAAQAISSVPLAYFSPQRAFLESSDGKAIQTKLTALQAERSKEVDTRNQRLRDMQIAARDGASMLSESARRQREQEVERFQIDLQRFIQDAQAEFLGAQRQALAAFEVKLRPALAAVAKEKGVWLVINDDEELIAWADPSLDITSAVIKRLEPVAQK